MSDDFPLMLEREHGMAEHVPQVAVAFGFHPVKNERKSEEAGHPVFEEKEFVTIVVPGDKQSVYFQPATEQHKKRFPVAYGRFKERERAPIEGTPLEEWPQITRSLAMTLKAAHIPTVETLAEVHDGHIDKFGFDMRGLRTKARAYLKTAKDTAAAQKFAAENQALKDQLAEMQRQINELSAPRKRTKEAADA